MRLTFRKNIVSNCIFTGKSGSLVHKSQKGDLLVFDNSFYEIGYLSAGEKTKVPHNLTEH